MEKDKHIEKILKETGLVSAPGNFTQKVMSRIHSEPVAKVYKPLIGRGGKLFILFILLGVLTVSIIFSGPTGFLAERNISLTGWNLNISNLPDLIFSKGLLAALVAIFLLLITDTALKRNRKLI